MNICNIYRTVLIYLLLCYGKKFINGDGIKEDRQNSPELNNRSESTQQIASTTPITTKNLNPGNINSNNNDSIDIVQAQLGNFPTQQVPIPSLASQAAATGQGHLDISLDSPSESEAEDTGPTVKRRITQKTGPEEPTSGSEIELDVPLDATAKRKLVQTTESPEAIPPLSGGIPQSTTLPGHPDLVILDLSEKYTTDKVEYVFNQEDQSHSFKPIAPNNLYHVKLGDTTAWKFSGKGDYPTQVLVVPDANGNPKLKIIFPEYTETETETESEDVAPKITPGQQAARPVARPVEATQPVAPPQAPPSQPTAPLPQLSQPKTVPPQESQFPQPQPTQPPQPPPPQAPVPQEPEPAPPQAPMDYAPGYGAPPTVGKPEIISVDIKNFSSTDQVDYFYYDREKIHKFLCKPNRLIGVLFKDGKIKKHFTENFPNRVLIMKDEQGAPLLRVLGPNDYDPNEPRYIPQHQMPDHLMPDPRMMMGRPMMDPRMFGQHMMDPRMMGQRMMDPRMDPRAPHRPPMPRRIPVEINVDNRNDTNEYKYDFKPPHTHLFTARQPFLFGSIRNNRKVLMTPQQGKLPDRVLYKDPQGQKPQLQVAYPEKPTMPPPHPMRDRMMPPRGPIGEHMIPPPHHMRDRMMPPRGPIRDHMMPPRGPMMPPRPPMGEPMMRHGPPPQRPKPQVKVTEEVSRAGPRLDLVPVDINHRSNTDKIMFSYDPDDGEYVFTAQSPYFISHVLAGRQVLWVPKGGKYPEEIRASYDQHGTPSLRVFYPEFEPQAQPSRLPRGPEPRPMVPGAIPAGPPAVPVGAVQLVEVDIKFFHSTNEIIYRFYPDYGVHKFICRPGFSIARVVKDGKLKREFTENFPNRVLLMKDEHGAPVIRILAASDYEPNEPADPELDALVPPITPPAPQFPQLEHEVTPPEELPVSPEVPEAPEEAQEDLQAPIPEDVPLEVAEEEVPEEHMPVVPGFDYSELVGIQLFLSYNQPSDKFDYTRDKKTGTRTFTAKDKFAFSSVKFPKTFSKPELLIWKASESSEFAKQVVYLQYGHADMEEINVHLYNGSQRKFIKWKNNEWMDLSLSKISKETLNLLADKETFSYTRTDYSYYVVYETRHPFLLYKIVSLVSGKWKTIWETDNPDFYVKKVERDNRGLISSVNNMTLFFVNGRIRHFTRVKVEGEEKWVQKSPHIDLDLSYDDSTLYYTYTEFSGFGTYTARNNVTFTTVFLGSSTPRVSKYIFSKAPYGKFCTRVITNIHFSTQRTKFVSVLYNDGKHLHFVSPLHRKQWQRVPLEVELDIHKKVGKYQFRYMPDDQLPTYVTNYNFLFSRIMQGKTQIWKSRDQIAAKLVIMDNVDSPNNLAVFLNNGKTIYFRKSGHFWSNYTKFPALHLELDNRNTTSCIIYKYDRDQKLDVYTPRSGLFINSVSNQHRHIWSTENENEYAKRVVLSETKLMIFQSDRKRLEFDRDMPFKEEEELEVLDPQYSYHV